jgi:3-oxoadipate enol-lactonase
MMPAHESLYSKQVGNGPAILLIHGLLMNGDMFEPVVEKLSSEYFVVTPDLRGFGRSGHLSPPDTVEQHAADLAELLRSISISSAIVVGYSQGGVVAQQLTLDYPHLVHCLVLCCTFACNRSTWQEKLEGSVVPLLLRLLTARQLANLAKGLQPEQLAFLETMIASNHRRRMVEAARAMLRFDSRSRLREIQCPTLVVAGAKDQAVPLHHARMLAEGISGAELRVFPEAGHELIWTHGPEFTNTVKSFVRNL